MLNAARTSDIWLRIRLTDASLLRRDCHSDLYAWKLACTSSSRVRAVVSSAFFSTIQPVTANNTVMATEVESRIFHSSEMREKPKSFTASLQDTPAGQ